MRPKNVIQKRNETKYWLPEGITLKDDLGQPNYRKETKLLFNDVVYGEFISTFKAIQDANASTHPEAIKKRRAETNLKQYGHANPGANKEIRKKAQNTTLERHGVKHALKSDKFLKKARETLEKNHGVKHPMYSPKLKNKQKQAILKSFGVDNPAKSPIIQEKIKKTNLKRYGNENASKSQEVIEKILKSRIESLKTGISKGELSLKKFIEEELGLKTRRHYIGGNSPKEIDILIPEKNIAIEYNGAFFHSDYHKHITSSYHLNKTRMCKKDSIQLIHIFDFEWEEKRKQIKSYLRSALGKNNRKIYARNCKLIKVDKQTTNKFLDDYHILGKVGHKHSYGLEYNGELLCLLTLGKHHRGHDEVILNRYAGKEDVTVVGGLSKLTKYVKNNHGTISTWIDLRFSSGENWIKCGWTKIKQLKPDYFYFDITKSKKVSKQSRKKSNVNTPEGMTEREHAISEGLFRIYDCGKLKLKT